MVHPSTGRGESNWNLTFRALTPSLTGADMNGGEWQIVCIRPVPGWSLRLCLGFKCTPLTFPLKGQVLCSLRRPPLPSPLPLTYSQPWGCKLSSSRVMPIYRCRLVCFRLLTTWRRTLRPWLAEARRFCAAAELKKRRFVELTPRRLLKFNPQPTAECCWKHKTHHSLCVCWNIWRWRERKKKAAAN